MKLFPYIKNELSKFSSNDDYNKLITGKFKTQDYQHWENLVSEMKIGGVKLYHESTYQNICYTAFLSFSRDFGDLKVVDFFYIHKSMIADFYTLYFKSKVVANYPEGKIMYPTTLIVSPESIYTSFFEEAKIWILKNFPKAQMIPFSILDIELDFKISYFKNEEVNYYRALFGYEGNILELPFTGDFRFRF